MLIKKILLAIALTFSLTQVASAQSYSNWDGMFDYEIQVSVKGEHIFACEFNHPLQNLHDDGIHSKAFKTEAEIDVYLIQNPSYSLGHKIRYLATPETKKYTVAKVGTYSAALDKVDEIEARDTFDYKLNVTIRPVSGIFLNNYRNP